MATVDDLLHPLLLLLLLGRGHHCSPTPSHSLARTLFNTTLQYALTYLPHCIRLTLALTEEEQYRSCFGVREDDDHDESDDDRRLADGGATYT